jgi:hypothetical protein
MNTLLRSSPLLESGAILFLDSIFLLGKLNPTLISPRLTQGVLFFFDCNSLIYLPYQCSLFRKTIVDFKGTRNSGHCMMQLAASLKVIHIFVSVILQSGNLMASASGFLEKKQLQSFLYRFMFPLGKVSIVLGLFLTVIEFQLLKSEKKFKENPIYIGEVVINLTGYVCMIVQKYYTPNSLQTAIINECIATVYFVKEIFKFRS